MADITTEGHKTVRCRSNREITIPLNTTGFKCAKNCPDCSQDHIVLVLYFGTIDGDFY